MRPVYSWKSTFILVAATGSLFLISVSTRPAAAEFSSQSAQVETASLQKEIDRLKNEKEYEVKRVEEMRKEREELIKEIRRADNQNAKQTKEIEALKALQAQQQETVDARMKKMESDFKDVQETKFKEQSKEQLSVPAGDLADIERKAHEILEKGGDLDPEDEKFKEELARAHYNMGNVYFERGEYQRSVVEYYQAVDLMPYDADAHYNLAYVSAEFIGDQDTALKHYQWYLYLKPNAQDRKLVEEKIVAAKLVGRSRVQSRLDKSDLSGHQNLSR